MPETRKRVAILVADLVGYGRLAAADEDRTFQSTEARRWPPPPQGVGDLRSHRLSAL